MDGGVWHCVVFGGFAPQELATRIEDSKAKLIVAATCGIEPGRVIEYMPMVNEAIKLSKHKVDQVVVLRREQQPYELAAGRKLMSDKDLTTILLGYVENPRLFHVRNAFAAGGVFESTDEGVNWTAVFDDQVALSIGDLATHPTDSVRCSPLPAW